MASASLDRNTVASAARAMRRNRHVRASLSSRIVVNGVLVVSTIYFLLPVWWLVVSSTKSNSDLFASNGFWFANFDLLANITAVLQYDGGHFLAWIGNSLLYAGVGSAVATLLGAACGYGLAKFQFRGRGMIFALIMSGLLLPASLLTIPLFLLFSALGVVNTVWAVLLPSFVAPFAVYLGRVFAADSVPDELLEAARVDGASEFRIFSTIVLRLMSPALVTTFLFTFVGIWNNFFLAVVMLSNQQLYPVTVGLYGWYSNQSTAVNYSVVITGALLGSVPVVLAFLSLQRFWREGIAAGALKG